MSMESWWQAFTISLELSHWQQFGLAFLLGSFAVATLSDLKYLSAQREFLEVWIVFFLAVLVLDVLRVRDGLDPWIGPASRWFLIAVLSVLSHRRVGVLFRLATGDVAALAAAACLLTPTLVLFFYAAAKLLAAVLGPMLARGRPHYPFMPVVSLATLAVLALGWVW